MPYIKEEDRQQLSGCGGRMSKTAGELNYILTVIILEYFKNNGANYQAINDISGAMTECLAEFRRRIVVDYEEKKIKLNGDCY